MKIILASSGKGAVLSGQVSADLFIDCRGMINPFRDPVLRGKSGDDPEVQNWIKEKNHDYLQAVLTQVLIALKTAPTRSGGRGKDSLRVCFFCLAGVHRSRGMKNVIGSVLKQDGYEVEVI